MFSAVVTVMWLSGTPSWLIGWASKGSMGEPGELEIDSVMRVYGQSQAVQHANGTLTAINSEAPIIATIEGSIGRVGRVAFFDLTPQ